MFQVQSLAAKASILFAMLGGCHASLPTFTNQSFPVGSAPTAIVVADFNGDQKLDLAVANHDSHNVSVLLGDGLGGFATATSFPTCGVPTSMALGDYNGDHSLDLIVGCQGSISVLLGNGQGGFGTASNFNGNGNGPGNSVVSSLVAGDFNRDQKLDLAVINYPVSGVKVLLGNGLGGFDAPINGIANLSPVGLPIALAVGDINGDGVLDLAIANESNVNVVVGDGMSNFYESASFPVHAANFPDGTQLSALTVADFNGDQKPDLAAVDGTFSDVSVLLGNGQGGFGPPSDYTFYVGGSSLVVGDFNGDQKPDLAVDNSANISLLLGDGQGGFGLSSAIPVGKDLPLHPSVNRLAVGDFNGDLKLDLVVANSMNNSVTVLINGY